MTISKAIDPARVGMSLYATLMQSSKAQGTCRVWTGTHSPAGYGRIGRKYVHRLAWESQFGPIPDGLYVCHRCDNPPCFMVEHLFLGTNADNQQDASRKGRKPHGTSHAGHRLSDDQVAAVRGSTDTQRAIAATLGVSQSLVSRIRAGKRRVAA